MPGLDTLVLLNQWTAVATEPVRQFGLAGIAQYNGWAAAFTGAIIVFSGLLLLSSIISQLHKVVNLLETSKKITVDVARAPEQKKNIPVNPLDPDRILGLYLPMIEELESEFQIADLYALAHKHQLPHPHLSIRCLREAGKLEFLGEGRFRYQA